MKSNIGPLQPDHFYHIYNRGINAGRLFFSHQNYLYFLKLLSEKVKPIAGVYSYCLLENHFHVLVKMKSENIIMKTFSEKRNVEVEKIISQQFSNMFNSYSQAINKHYGRTGKLFELPFRRKEIITDQQLINTILYINKNPVKHKITNNFLTYPYSSANEIIYDKSLFVEREEVIALFEDSANFISSMHNFAV